jgi:predicted lipoprotein with Yx(FWY)xxD motif
MKYPRRTIAAIAGTLALSAFTATGVAAGNPDLYGTPPQVHHAASIAATTSAGQTGPGPTLHATKVSVNGKKEAILVDANNLPVYYYQLDTASKSAVTGTLAQLWPPLDASAPTASGVKGKVTSVNDTHGHQVAYNGHLLYTFVDDSAEHVTGQDVSHFVVATPSLKPSGATIHTVTPAGSTSNRYGY